MAAKKQYNTKRVYVASASYDIPVDKDGYVPTSALLNRFKNRSVGVSNGKKSRNLVKDYDSYADVVLPEKLTPEQAAAWWHRPAEYDIEGIDTPGPVKTRKGINMYGTDMEVEKMGEMIDATHSKAEVEKIAKNGVTYTARPLKSGTMGLYRPGTNGVELDRATGMHHTTVAHETTHAMRHTDKSRKGVLTTENDRIGIEESCTVAEEMARSRKGAINGYYQLVPVFDEDTRRWRKPTDEEAVRMCREDHMLFTYGRGKPLKEKEAIQSVEENWERSNIARLRYKSRKMAISEIAMQDPKFKGKDEELKAKARGSKTVPKKKRTEKTGTTSVTKKKTGQQTLFSIKRKSGKTSGKSKRASCKSGRRR